MVTFKTSEAIKRLPVQFFSSLRKRADEVIKENDDVIDLGVGNPDLSTPDFIIKELKKAVEEPSYSKYGPYRGYDYLKEAVADYYLREYGVEVDPYGEVAVLHGSKTGIFEISQCILNPGDTALVPDPFYPDYFSGLNFADAITEKFPLQAENNFLPDYSLIKDEVAEKAKLMFLNYPNNPTGAVATKKTFEDTVSYAMKHRIGVIHDFAYGAIGFDGIKPLSFLQTPGAKDIGIEFLSLSKSYNLAGWRIAFAVGNSSIIESIHLLQDHTNVGMYGGIQQAAAKALEFGQDAAKEISYTYERRRNQFIEELKYSELDIFVPKGTFYVWVKTPKGYTSNQFFDLLLNEAHVVVSSGNGFGSQGEGYVRVGLCQSDEKIVEAAKRIKQLTF